MQMICTDMGPIASVGCCIREVVRFQEGPRGPLCCLYSTFSDLGDQEWPLERHGDDKKNGTPRPNWATPRNAHKSSTFSISSLFAPHLAVVFTHLYSMSSPTHHEIEEIEKVDDLCAFRGVAQLGLGVPFFLSPP